MNKSANMDIPENINDESSLDQVIQNFDEMNIKKIETSKNNFITVIDKIVDFHNKLEGNDDELNKQKTLDYLDYLNDLNNYNITSQEIYNWLLNNQNGPNFIVALGNFYYLGINTDIDKEKAFKLYQTASSLGNNYGLINLGYCYQFGIGTRVDYQKAFALYQKSADLGNSSAQFNLGYMYDNGEGMEGIVEDVDLATFWYQQAEKQEAQS